jgi:hypothetical protein
VKTKDTTSIVRKAKMSQFPFKMLIITSSKVIILYLLQNKLIPSLNKRITSLGRKLLQSQTSHKSHKKGQRHNLENLGTLSNLNKGIELEAISCTWMIHKSDRHFIKMASMFKMTSNKLSTLASKNQDQ